MNEPETASTVISTPRRAWFRLRWRAWLLLACCGAMFTALNLAGRSGVDPLWHYGRVTRFGWPIVFRRQVDQATVLWSPPDVVLEIGSDQVTDDGLSQLAALRRLRRLGLSCPKITDAGLEYVASLQQLERLRLWGHHAWEDGFVRTGPGLTPLTRLLRLESLDLATAMDTAITPEALSIVQKLPALRSLSLSGHGVTDATLMVVAGMADLEHLSIQNPFITSVGLVPLRRLTKLRSLSAAGCSGPRDDALAAIAGMKGLTYLSLHGGVTTDGELEQLAALHELRDLWFDRYGNPSITPSGVARLQNALPNCKIH